MSPADSVRLQHMVDAIETAMGFVQGRSRKDLDGDEMLLFALVRAIEIVGEAASRLSTEGRAGSAWRAMDCHRGYAQPACARLL